jgi:hypothetical protein
MTATLTRHETGMAPAMRMLDAAGCRRLVAVTDVVDRAHLMWLAPGQEPTEAPVEECQLVKDLLAAGLAQLGDFDQTLPWYGGTHAHGKHVLPTVRGLAALERWRLYGTETATAGWAGVS